MKADNFKFVDCPVWQIRQIRKFLRDLPKMKVKESQKTLAAKA
jgi:hypothetical protein